MAEHAGKLMIIQRETETPGTWENLCGFNNVTFTVNNAVNSEEKVNCTDRSLVVQTIKTYGAQNMSFEGSGLFDDDAKGQYLADQARTQGTPELRVFVPGHGYYECATWLIGTVTFTGGPTGSLGFQSSLEASGTVTFTAVE